MFKAPNCDVTEFYTAATTEHIYFLTARLQNFPLAVGRVTSNHSIRLFFVGFHAQGLALYCPVLVQDLTDLLSIMGAGVNYNAVWKARGEAR